MALLIAGGLLLKHKTQPTQSHQPSGTDGTPQRTRLSRLADTASLIPSDEKLEEVSRIGSVVSSQEVATALEILEDQEQSIAVRNNLLNVLRTQDAPPEELVSRLIRIYKDASQGEGMRDYSLQHLGVFYERAPVADRAKIIDTLWMATADTIGTISATALIQLEQLSEFAPEIERERLAAIALQLAGDDAKLSGIRMTAIQVCSRTQAAGAMDIGKRLAVGNHPVALRVAAIAAVGDLGRDAVMSWLAELAVNSEEPIVRTAAEAAISRLQAKQNQLQQNGG